MYLNLYSFHPSLPTCAPIIPKQQDASSRFTFKDHKNSMTPRGINEYFDLALLQSRRQGNSCGKPASPGHYIWMFCGCGAVLFCIPASPGHYIWMWGCSVLYSMTHGCFVGVGLFCFVFQQALVITFGCFVGVGRFCFVFGFMSLVLLLLFGGLILSF